MTEAQAGTRDTPGPHASRLLLILAADHRSSLERDLYGLTAAPTPEQAAWISADKMLIYQALLDAVPELAPSAQPGILIDEQYGAAIAELAARTGGVVSLAMPVEASGEQWFRHAYDDWQVHAGFFATDYAKIAIRDHPGLEPGQRAAQADRLATVSDWAAANDRALIVELLVPASAADLAAAGGVVASYDATLRPERTVQVIEFLQDHGVVPAVWGVEGLDQHDDAVAIAAAARRGGRAADCIVLGRQAGEDRLDHWLQVAAPVPGFTGFAIGRSIWWHPLHARMHHRSTAGGARRRIGSAYLDLARYFLDARDGTLPVQYEPET
jgi:myo-inositol catabolism protein IolC